MANQTQLHQVLLLLCFILKLQATSTTQELLHSLCHRLKSSHLNGLNLQGISAGSGMTQEGTGTTHLYLMENDTLYRIPLIKRYFNLAEGRMALFDQGTRDGNRLQVLGNWRQVQWLTSILENAGMSLAGLTLRRFRFYKDSSVEILFQRPDSLSKLERLTGDITPTNQTVPLHFLNVETYHEWAAWLMATPTGTGYSFQLAIEGGVIILDEQLRLSAHIHLRMNKDALQVVAGRVKRRYNHLNPLLSDPPYWNTTHGFVKSGRALVWMTNGWMVYFDAKAVGAVVWPKKGYTPLKMIPFRRIPFTHYFACSEAEWPPTNATDDDLDDELGFGGDELAASDDDPRDQVGVSTGFPIPVLVLLALFVTTVLCVVLFLVRKQTTRRSSGRRPPPRPTGSTATVNLIERYSSSKERRSSRSTSH